MTVYEMAKLYYPRLWSKERIEALLKAEKLTEKEAESVLNSNETGE